MAKPDYEKDAPTLGGALQSLFVAGVRMSAGFTLYGLEQTRNAIEAVRGDGLAGAAEKLETAFDTLSDTMENGLDETKKEALRSISRVTAKAVEKYVEFLSPGGIFEAANNLLSKGAGSDSSAKAGKSHAPQSAPLLASDVLSGPGDA